MPRHPLAIDLVDYVDDKLDPVARVEIDEHIAGCRRCTLGIVRLTLVGEPEETSTGKA